MSPDIIAPKVLLMGPQGTGKTTSLRTLLHVQPKIEVFGIITEPLTLEVLADILPQIHYKLIVPYAPDWSVLADVGRKVNTMSNEALQKMKGIEQTKFTQWLDIIDACNNFVDQNGVSFGDVAKWDHTKVLFIDSLTGVNKAARALVAGAKPNLTQPDWGTAMSNLQMFVDTLAVSTRCSLIIIAHVEQMFDEVTGGGQRLMVSTLGRKLAPVLPANLGDIILTKREGTSFYWSTADPRADLKAHNLPLSEKLQPSFVPLYTTWGKRVMYHTTK